MASVDVYDASTDTWSPVAPMSTARAVHHAVCSHDGFVYVSGGFHLAGMERYDISTDTWAEMEPMPVVRWMHDMCRVGGDLYVVGGWVGGEPDSSVLKYEVSSNSWVAVASMPTARSAPGVCVVGAQLYCIGGETVDEDEDGDEVHVEVAVVERYDTVSGRWTSLNCSHAHTSVISGCVYDTG